MAFAALGFKRRDVLLVGRLGGFEGLLVRLALTLGGVYLTA